MRLPILTAAIALLAGSAPLLSSAQAPAGEPPAPAGACEDFYAHANAAWLADPAAPASPFAALAAQSQQRQRVLLDGLAADPGADAKARQLATFWRAANDEAALDAAGIAVLHPWLQRVDALRKSDDVAELLAEAHAAGLPLLFRFEAGADLREPHQRSAYALQGGLALPDRDYYLRDDPASTALRTHYRAYVARLLQLSGTPAAELQRAADSVLDIETRLARASLSLVQLRDPNNAWRPTDIRELDQRFAKLELRAFLRAQGLRRLRTVSLAHTAFFVEADHLVGALPIAQWRPYLRFHLLHALAPHLSRPYRDAHFALFGTQLRGLAEPPPRWQQALQATDQALGEWLGERYAARWLDAASAARVRAVADGVLAALKRRLGAADWLGAEAQAGAAAKLDGLDLAIGHADPAPRGELPTLAPDRHAANVLAAARWRQASELALLQEPAAPATVRGHAVNAFYDLRSNRLALSAALLAPPLLADTTPAAAAVAAGAADAAAASVAAEAPPAAAGEHLRAHDYGGLGSLIAHELWHAVDAQGATVDASGAVRSWWTADDFRRFTERTRALADQYGGYAALGEVKVDGKRSFLENLADLAGLSLAWEAWQAASPQAQDAAAQQRFFSAYAGLWRRRMDMTAQRLQLATGVHAPPQWRVMGALANFTPFASAYGCTPGASFVLPLQQRLEPWP